MTPIVLEKIRPEQGEMGQKQSEAGVEIKIIRATNIESGRAGGGYGTSNRQGEYLFNFSEKLS